MKRLGYIGRSARISGRPAIPPFERGRVLYEGFLVWVSYWLTFCKWSNGPIHTPLIPQHDDGLIEEPVPGA